jgi:hypothetical protein
MVLDLNLYKGFITNSIFYLEAKVLDNINVEIKISFFNLVIYPNPITLGLNVSFSYKRKGGLINYTCDNINYENLVNNKFNLILRCNQISGGIFNQDNLLNSYLVIDNSNNNYQHALENLLYSKFYFQINKEIISFDGNLFETNIGNISLYIDNIVNSKIVNLSGDNVQKSLNNVNYSLLNITNKPTFKYKLINNNNNNKSYEIIITFIGSTVDELNESTIKLFKDDLFNTLFYDLDLIFYIDFPINKLLNSKNLNTSKKITNLNSKDATTIVKSECTLTTFAPPPKLCISVDFPYTYTTSNIGTEDFIYEFIIGNIYVKKGATLTFQLSKNSQKGNIAITNGLQNYGTINFDTDVSLSDSNISTSTDNLCPSFNIDNYWANYGIINMNGNTLQNTGETELKPHGVINS